MCNAHAILASMMEEQREHQFCRLGEAYIRYRKVVAEWMMDVCDYFSLHPTTTLAAIAYLDRLQPSDKFSRYEWQMLAICCILISGAFWHRQCLLARRGPVRSSPFPSPPSLSLSLSARRSQVQ
jgi:hypothetical protein